MKVLPPYGAAPLLRVLILVFLLSLPASQSFALEYTTELAPVEDKILEEAAKASSLLIELQDKPPDSFFGLYRRAQEDKLRLEKALRSSGYYDGAVIIQNDRIAAAACFLPLSVNPRLSKDLGTRHRAALGLTEENDAVAIVVSEETGSISLVVNGDIERGVTGDRLRASLRALRGQRRSAAERRDARSVMA